MGASRYEVFCKVVELGSLTQAAEVLGYTQPGISHIISAMEEEFGFPLLIRSRSGVRPTADGERVLPIIRRIFKRHRAADPGRKRRQRAGRRHRAHRYVHLRSGTLAARDDQRISNALSAY